MTRAAAILMAVSMIAAAACSDRGPAGGRSGAKPDWLIHPSSFRASVRVEGAEGRVIHLENGLVRRTFRLSPNAASVDLRNLASGEAVLRAVRPEASVVLDGRPFDVGGLAGGAEQGYLLDSWPDAMTADPGAYRLRDYETGPIEERMNWRRNRYAEDRP